jgi:hypothetical protein
MEKLFNTPTWEPLTSENKFVNKMWEIFSDTPFANAQQPQDTYTVSFEAMDCFFRNIYSLLNSDLNDAVSDTTGDDSSNADD